MKFIEGTVQTIPSYEVAEMMDGKQHWEVLRMLEGYEPPKGSKSRKVVGIIPTLNDHNVVVVDYFIKSSYVDAKGETRKCYECTKMGCELLANKMTGEKGILFTARYVAKFNAMEKAIELPSTEGIRKLVEEELDKKVPQMIGCKDAQVKAIVKAVKGNLGIKNKKQNFADYETVMAWLLAKHNVYKLEDIPFSDEIYIDINNFIRKLSKQKRLF